MLATEDDDAQVKPVYGSGWKRCRLKHLGKALIGLTYSPDDVVDPGMGYPVLRANNIQNGRLHPDGIIYVDARVPERLRLREGDILICSRNGSRHLIGKNGKVTREFSGMTFGAFNTVVRSDSADFLYWVLQSSIFEEQTGAYLTSTINQLTVTTLNNLSVLVPDLETQRQIADFLDRETARIDLLIEKKQRLVALLDCRYDALRESILALDDNIFPKRSMRWLARVGSGDFLPNEKMSPNKSPDNPFPVVGGNGTMAYTNRSNSPPGTLVIGRVGALCGNVHFYDISSWVTDNALIVRLISKDILPRYAFEIFVSARLNEKANKNAQPLITGETIKRVTLRLPDPGEQERRVASLELLTTQLTELKERILSSITLLKEYRSALITAAVTGQIDVQTYGRSGTVDRRLDAIQEEMEA
ncbi:type I restriction modification DNA specificity domain protein [Phaeobacter gallaeciensis]|uniref:Type I restriction modification DNA specificity domain protein n=1 Tax=Phaeobacter gallaeciensis TaxID=60890 RepID=A0A1B0ZTW1_9RHOB|nr:MULTISPECIES: restriction endonuclease subunit S [Phaeobacter]ANP37595.1 type I restriction modification DNA specificity domain protein [Phaeobacter gallaeciensis]PVZ44919.1 restriction endonuclease subunit S [Phaeobacter sp. JL2872]